MATKGWLRRRRQQCARLWWWTQQRALFASSRAKMAMVVDVVKEAHLLALFASSVAKMATPSEDATSDLMLPSLALLIRACH